jgi:hypothetical protein
MEWNGMEWNRIESFHELVFESKNNAFKSLKYL